jgi:predicted XRE-type DNA-binding protein
MSRLVKPKLKYVERVIGKGVEKLTEKLGERHEESQKNEIIKLKEVNQKGAKRRAERLGLLPISDAELKIRQILNQKVIYEVKSKKLTHVEVAGICLCSRPKITRIMNHNLKGVSADFLIKILSMLGTHIDIRFTNIL